MKKLRMSNASLLVALAGAVIVGAQLTFWLLLAIGAIDSIFGIWPSVCSVIAGTAAVIFGAMGAWNRTNTNETIGDQEGKEG